MLFLFTDESVDEWRSDHIRLGVLSIRQTFHFFLLFHLATALQYLY